VNREISVQIAARNEENRNCIISALSNNNDIQIVSIENDEANTVIKSERYKPDVLIMDIQPHGMDGTELAPIIRRKSPSTSIIMMSDRDEFDYAGRSLKAGISGFMLRNTDMNKLIPAVKIVSLGGHYVSSSVITRALETLMQLKQMPGQFTEPENDYFSLSATEQKILNYIARGFTYGEIARQLHFSMGTIKNSLLTIKHKTNLKNRTQIVLYSLIHGLIRVEHLGI